MNKIIVAMLVVVSIVAFSGSVSAARITVERVIVVAGEADYWKLSPNPQLVMIKGPVIPMCSKNRAYYHEDEQTISSIVQKVDEAGTLAKIVIDDSWGCENIESVNDTVCCRIIGIHNTKKLP